MQRMLNCVSRLSAQRNTHPTGVYQTVWLQPLIRYHIDNHDYIIILLYLGDVTSSGQIQLQKLFNSVSFASNKNLFGGFIPPLKRSISTKGIRNWSNFDLVI